MAKCELGLRTDGVIMTRMNKTTQWVEQQIEELGEEEFDKWFNIVVSTAFTQAQEDEYKANHAETNAMVKERRRAKLAADKRKKDNQEELLTLAGEEEFDAVNLEANFADLETGWRTPDEVLLKIKRQWQRLKMIGNASKIPARQIGWPNQLGVTKLAEWKAQFEVLFKTERLMGILEKGLANLKKEATKVVRPHALGEVLDAIPMDVGVDEEVLDAYKRKLESQTNMNMHRSKAHRDAAKGREDGGQPEKKKRKTRTKKQGAAEAIAEAP